MKTGRHGGAQANVGVRLQELSQVVETMRRQKPPFRRWKGLLPLFCTAAALHRIVLRYVVRCGIQSALPHLLPQQLHLPQRKRMQLTPLLLGANRV